MLTRSIVALLVILASGFAAAADPAKILPFWSKPFPSGYAAAGGEDHCLVRRRIRTRHGFRTEFIDTCRPAISARD